MLSVGAVGQVGIGARRQAGQLPGPPATSATVVPVSTVSVSGWSPDGAATVLEAVTASDSAFAVATADGAAVLFALSNPVLSSLDSGTLTVRHRRVE